MFYDLVIEVAIGTRSHPRQYGSPLSDATGEERHQGFPTRILSKELEAVLERTLGVPLFQEQAMQIAIVGAGFTPARSRPTAPSDGNLPPLRHHRFISEEVRIEG